MGLIAGDDAIGERQLRAAHEDTPAPPRVVDARGAAAGDAQVAHHHERWRLDGEHLAVVPIVEDRVPFAAPLARPDRPQQKWF